MLFLLAADLTQFELFFNFCNFNFVLFYKVPKQKNMHFLPVLLVFSFFACIRACVHGYLDVHGYTCV